MTAQTVDIKHNTEYWFKILYAPLYNYAIRFVDTDLAHDLLQDMFMDIEENSHKYSSVKNMKGYLFKILKNKCISYWKTQTIVYQSLEDPLPHIKIEELRHTNESHDLIVGHELEKEINNIISSLPPKCKEVFLLSRNENLKNREIAELLGISLKSVEKHIGKALKEFKKHLKTYLTTFITMLIMR